MKILKFKKKEFLNILKFLNNILYKSKFFIIKINKYFIRFIYFNKFIKFIYFYKKKSSILNKKIVLDICDLNAVTKHMNLNYLKFIVKKNFLKLKDKNKINYKINRNFCDDKYFIINNKKFKIKKKTINKNFLINKKKITTFLKFLNKIITNKNFKFLKKNILLTIFKNYLKFSIIENTYMMSYKLKINKKLTKNILFIENAYYLLKILSNLIFNFKNNLINLKFKLIKNKIIWIRFKNLILFYKIKFKKSNFLILKNTKKTLKNYLIINYRFLKEIIINLSKISSDNIFEFILKKNNLTIKVNNNSNIFEKKIKVYYNSDDLRLKIKIEILINFLKDLESKNLIFHFLKKIIIITLPNNKSFRIYIPIFKIY